MSEVVCYIRGVEVDCRLHEIDNPVVHIPEGGGFDIVHNLEPHRVIVSPCQSEIEGGVLLPGQEWGGIRVFIYHTTGKTG